MNAQMTITTEAANVTAAPATTGVETPPVVLRTARSGEAAQIHALIQEHLEEGHLLPRRLEELELRLSRFVVAVADHRVLACAELAPLSSAVAEVRSLVVHHDARHEGLGRQLVNELMRRARVEGFDTLCAFTHGPGYFVRMGFSIVPHHWVREKIAVDCQGCALFRTCGQYAVVLSLNDKGRGGRAARA